MVAFRVEVAIPHGMTKVQARQELRSRVNDQCGYHTHITHRGERFYLDEDSVRIKRIN